MKRRLFSIITALALALSLLPGRALAAEGEPGGGTVVSTAEALRQAVAAVASGGTTTITLAADVDMGTAALQITGGDVTLDCGGHTLSGSGNQTIYIDMTNGSLTVRNGTVKNIGGNYGINMSGLGGTLTVAQGAVIAADGNPYSQGIFSSNGPTVHIYGRVTGTRIGIHAAGELNLYHGAVITGGTYALFMENSKTVTVQEDAKAYLNGTELTTQVTTTGPGTLVICRDHQPSTSADGWITCSACGYSERAAARVQKDGAEPVYVTSLPVAFTEANSGATITMLDNVSWNGEPVKISAGSFTLELNGKTITNAQDRVFYLDGGSLTVNGEGSIISENSNAIYLYDYDKKNSVLTVNGGTIRTNGNRANAILVDYGAVTVKDGQIISQCDAKEAAALRAGYSGSANIHGGTFTGGVRANGATKLYGGVFTSVTPGGVSVYTSSYLSDLLDEGFAFFDGSDSVITGEALRGEELTGTIQVLPCPHPETKYQFTETTHQSICTVCGETTAPADHVWDASGTHCTVCGYYPEPVQVVVDGGAPVCYANLEEAWTAAIAGTNAAVTLLADVSSGSLWPWPTLAVPTGKTVTLLGGGHTVSGYMILNGDEPTGDDAPTGGGTLNIEACTFTGGGVSVAGGTAALTGCTFTDYESVYVAGGTAELTNCTFTDETGVSVRGGTAELTNCTFTDYADVYVRGGTAELTSCTAKTLEPCVVASGGEVIINSGTYTATDEAAEAALLLSGDGRAALRGGSFSGPGAAIAFNSEEGAPSLTLPDLLSHTETTRYAYYGSDGRPIALADLTALPPAVTVKACAEPHIRHVADTLTHDLTCAYCGHNSGLAVQNCAYVFDGTAGTCSVCGDVVTVTATAPESLIYDGALKAFTVTVMQGDRTLTADTDYTVAYDGGTNAGKASLAVAIGEDQGTYTSDFTVLPRALTVTGITVKDRVYDGTNRAEITGVTLEGAVPRDAVSVNTAGLTGTLSGTDAGTYTAVTLPALTLAGEKAANYTLTQPAGAMAANVTVGKATLPAKAGTLEAVNGRAYTYTYGLGALLPELPEGMSLGGASYELGTVSLDGSYYADGAKIEGQTLTLPIQSVDSEDAGEIGTVTVIIHTGNFEDMTATISVRSVNKIIPEGAPTLSAATLTYGQALGSITLSGSMRDGGKAVPGTFAWSSPDNRPAAQESYAAAWVFTPADSDAYAVVNGVSDIRVLPAPISGAEIALEPAAFRDDGHPHAPGVASVRLGEVTLTAGVDYAAEIPTGTEAGTYTVTVTGQGNYTGTATVTFTINWVETGEEFQGEGDTVLRLEVETGLSSVPAALVNDTRYDTPKKIENELRTKVRDAMTNVGESIAVFDVTLQYRDSEGTWRNVDPNDFPKNGVTAILPYPDGTGATGYRFTVQHLISSGTQAGTIEPLAYELTADGLKCNFYSLSPVAIGYEAEEKPAPQPAPGVDLDWGFWPVPEVPSPAPAPVEQPEPEPEPEQPCDGGAGCPSRGFADLTAGAWYHEAVDYALRNGLMTGYSNGAFGPDDHLSRAQLAQILYNRAGKPAVTGGSGFTDVPDGKWYAPAVAWAAANGVVSGYGNGLFGPDDNVTREQLAVMLWRYAGSPAATERELRFTDADRASGWALEALRWAVENGILGGYGDGRLDPGGLATRAQAAQMLMDAIGDQEESA